MCLIAAWCLVDSVMHRCDNVDCKFEVVVVMMNRSTYPGSAALEVAAHIVRQWIWMVFCMFPPLGCMIYDEH